MNRSNYLKAFVIFIATNHFILLNGYRTEAWWDTITVDTSSVVGSYSPIALDASNEVHILAI